MLHKIIDKFSYLIEERTAATRRCDAWSSLGWQGHGMGWLGMPLLSQGGCAQGCINNAAMSDVSLCV